METTLQKVIDTNRFTRLNREQLLAVVWWIERGMKKKGDTFEETLKNAVLFYTMEDKDFMDLPDNLLKHIKENKKLLRDFNTMCLLHS